MIISSPSKCTFVLKEFSTISLRFQRTMPIPAACIYNPFMPNSVGELLLRNPPVTTGGKRGRELPTGDINEETDGLGRGYGAQSTIAITANTSVDAILEERLKHSVTQGVARAKDLAREQSELAYKERLLLSGGDAKSKMADRVQRMRSTTTGVDLVTGEATIVAVPCPPTFSEGAGSSSPQVDLTKMMSSAAPPSVALVETHLEFQRSKGGKHVITAAAAASPSSNPKVQLSGKPSSTLLIRNLILRNVFYGRAAATGGGVPGLDAQILAALAFRDRIIAEVSSECGKCGHVREVVVVDNLQAPVGGSQDGLSSFDAPPFPHIPALAPSHSWSPPPSSTMPDREAIAVWVRMDMVTSAFKAAERLNGKIFMGDAARLAVVSFYPTTLFDQGVRTISSEHLNPNGGGTQRSTTIEGPALSNGTMLPPTFGAVATASSLPTPRIVEPLESLLPVEYASL